MAQFEWKGVGRNGQSAAGVVEATNQSAVENMLRAKQITVTSVKAKKEAKVGGKSVPLKELVIFTRQFVTMIEAGLPIVQCLEILGNQQPNANFKVIIGDVKAQVETGSTFADALRRHPKVFDTLYCNLVQAGEVGGLLDNVLGRLAVYLEKADKLRREVKGALTYPIITLLIAIGAVAILLLFVIPTFEKMFNDFGRELPAPTQFVIDLSKWLQAYIGHLLAVIVSAVFAFRAALKNKKFHYSFDKFMLKVPLFGDLIKKSAVARFTQTMGTLLGAGVPIMDSLDIVASVAGNMIIEEELISVKTAIGEGKQMTEPLKKSVVFPSMVVQMIEVGEQTGAMDTMLNKIASFYEEEVEAAVAAITSAIEPAMMVFIGGIVGGILIAMYMPIFTLAG
jgi:type IV pilus assembly protein PilC